VAEIYRRHAPSVYRRALQILGSEIEAREVLRELFVSLLERPAQAAAPRAQLSAHLYEVTTRACLQRLRGRRHWPRLVEPALDLSALMAGPRRALSSALRNVLPQLPESLAVVAIYHLVDGLDQQEMALLLGCSQGQVEQQLERMRGFGRAAETACPAE